MRYFKSCLLLSQGGSAVGVGGQRVDERGQRTELAQPPAHDPPHHQSHPLVREVSSVCSPRLRLATVSSISRGEFLSWGELVLVYRDDMKHGRLIVQKEIKPAAQMIKCILGCINNNDFSGAPIDSLVVRDTGRVFLLTLEGLLLFYQACKV